MPNVESFWRGELRSAVSSSQSVPFTLSVSVVPNNENMYFTVDGDSDDEEIFYFTTKTGTVGGPGTLNVTGRGYNKHNSSQSTSNQRAHGINSPYNGALNHINYQDFATLSGESSFTGSLKVPVFASASARDAAIPSPTAGLLCFLADANEFFVYKASIGWSTAGGGGGGSAVWYTASTSDGSLVGAVNGTNVNFTLPAGLGSTEAIWVIRNGIVLEYGEDYTISGTTMTMTTAPVTGSKLLVTYPSASVGVGDVVTNAKASSSASNGELFRDSGSSYSLSYKDNGGVVRNILVAATGKFASDRYDFATITDGASTTKLVSPYMAGVLAGWGGTGADGAVDGSADITLAGSNDTVVEKDYTSWAAGGVARACTITPTGCITRIRIAGDANFTNWTFNFDAKGTAGGASITGTAGAGRPGATSLMGSTGGQGGAFTAGVGSGGAGSGASSSSNGTAGSSDTGATGGAAGVGVKPLVTQALARIFKGMRVDVGTGGAGGALYNSTATPSGKGGNGGGCIVFEIAGNVNFGSCTFNLRGENGANGTASSAAGGGAGGGGGTLLVVYSGAKTGTYTANVTGGNPGTNGNSNTAAAAAGATGFSYDFKRSD
jgi:hypothetical protein